MIRTYLQHHLPLVAPYRKSLVPTPPRLITVPGTAAASRSSSSSRSEASLFLFFLFLLLLDPPGSSPP